MEADRFGHNHRYYIVGIICLILSISLFAFSLFVFPYLIFGWHYSVPAILPIFSGIMQAEYKLAPLASGWLIFLGIFLPAIFLAVIADVLSNKIDSEIHNPDLNEDELEEETLKPAKRLKVGEKESKGLVLKILMIIVLVFVASQFFQWALSTSPS